MNDSNSKTRLRRELATLTAIDGVSGHEQDVVRYLQQEIEPLVDRVEIDPMGNLYAFRQGAGRHLMLAAHSDEIGALVSAVEPDGSSCPKRYAITSSASPRQQAYRTSLPPLPSAIPMRQPSTTAPAESPPPS